MNINELPEKILVHILSFLPPSDRLESALTCRQWAQTVARAPPLLRDIWLVYRSAETDLPNSQRYHENLRLRRARALSFNTTLWANVGPNLRKLEIIGRLSSPDVLHSILQACCNLESLVVYRFKCEEFSSATQDTLEHLMPLFDLRKLRILHINLNLETDFGGFISEKFLRELARLSSLETLTLDRWLGIVDSTRLRILAGLPKLRNLKTVLRVDAESLQIAFFDLEKLQTLKIVDDGLGSKPKRDFSTHLNHIGSERQGELEVLKLRGVPLTDACLRCVTAHHRRLRVVHFTECHSITATGLVTLFQHEQLLEELKVSFMYYLDGTFLEGLEEQCPRLRSLRIGPYVHIRREAWEFTLRRPEVKLRFDLK